MVPGHSVAMLKTLICNARRQFVPKLWVKNYLERFVLEPMLPQPEQEGIMDRIPGGNLGHL